MTVGAEVEGESWLRIDGKEHEIYKISPYTRKQLLKTAQDLRDKRILGIKDKSDVRAIQLRRKGETPLVLERNAERWSRASDGALADSDAINLFLNALVKCL